MEKVKSEIEKRLREKGVNVDDEIPNSQDIPITTEEEALDQKYIIKFIVAGAFYPNYFSTIPADGDNVNRTLNGKNERTTVQVILQ